MTNAIGTLIGIQKNTIEDDDVMLLCIKLFQECSSLSLSLLLLRK